MPEGPELHVSGWFVDRFCKDRIFSGKVEKSAVSTKNPDVQWDFPAYTIKSTTRGKEIRLLLTELDDGQIRDAKSSRKKGGKAKAAKQTEDTTKQISIRFNFGMSGKFVFREKSELDKHCHLNFYSRDDDMVLSFSDYRRFGRWEVTEKWGKDRGPCIILEYELFRKNVIDNLLKPSLLDKPICEVMLNQEFFNGIGNYLRAEILYRLSIPPFVSTRSVIEPLREAAEAGIKVETEKDFLALCNTVPTEVINLKGGLKYIYDPSKKTSEDIQTFMDWLQCYYKEGMANLVDHQGRTIWFKGPAGPLKPKDTKTRGRVAKHKPAKNTENASEEKESEVPKKKAKQEVQSKKTKKPAQKANKKCSRSNASAQKEPKNTHSKRKSSKKTTERAKGSRVQPRRSCTRTQA